MHLIPVTPPAHVQVLSGFDYVATDAERRRVYAAHTGSNALLIVNADSGVILGQADVGPLHGVAVDPANGHVYTGDGEARTVSEIDPVTQAVLRTASVDGNVDAIAYDAALHRVYADEDDGTRMFVIDTQSMKLVGTVALPGHKPEYLAINPQTHHVYQNIDNLSEIVVIDPQQLTVTRTIATPNIQHNHPLQYDPAYHVLLVGGKNATIASYSPEGKLLATARIQATVDQCDLNASTHMLACAGSSVVTVLQLEADGHLSTVATREVDKGVHTLAFDPKTGHIWIVWASPKGDFVQPLTLAP